MLCQKCKKNQASSHIKQVINGNTKEYYLCSKCADELGIYGLVGSMDLDLDNFFSDFFAKPAVINAPRMICPSCKSTISDISNRGKVGCANCYDVFRNELEPIIERLHGNVRHVGKTPQNAIKTMNNEQKIEKLKNELDKAVKQQNYELAAEYRDKIRELENKNNNDKDNGREGE